jgi:hypothetical protein
VFVVWRGRSRDQVCAVLLRYVDDWGDQKCGALVVGQDSLADVLGDVQDRREAPQCSDFGAGWEDTAKTYGGVRCL